MDLETVLFEYPQSSRGVTQKASRNIWKKKKEFKKEIREYKMPGPITKYFINACGDMGWKMIGPGQDLLWVSNMDQRL